MRRLYIALVLATLAGLATVAVLTFGHMNLVGPWRFQTPKILALAYRINAWAPPWTLLLSTLGLAVIVALLRRAGHRQMSAWRKGASYLGMTVSVLVLGLAVRTAWIHVPELRIKPLPVVEHVPIAQADHVADDIPVLGIEIDGEARAYPLNLLVFHHIANDVVAGQPIAATY